MKQNTKTKFKKLIETMVRRELQASTGRRKGIIYEVNIPNSLQELRRLSPEKRAEAVIEMHLHEFSFKGLSNMFSAIGGAAKAKGKDALAKTKDAIKRNVEPMKDFLTSAYESGKFKGEIEKFEKAASEIQDKSVEVTNIIKQYNVAKAALNQEKRFQLSEFEKLLKKAENESWFSNSFDSVEAGVDAYSEMLDTKK